jgi:hypothetical protein
MRRLAWLRTPLVYSTHVVSLPSAHCSSERSNYFHQIILYERLCSPLITPCYISLFCNSDTNYSQAGRCLPCCVSLGIIVLFTIGHVYLLWLSLLSPVPQSEERRSTGTRYPTIKDRTWPLSQSTVPILFPLEKGEKEDNLEIQVLYQAGGVTEAEIKSEKTRAFFVALVGKIRAETVSRRESTRDCDLVHVEDWTRSTKQL